MKKRDPYEVGYGKPPLHSQFAKGQSGNPKGRPKGSLSLAAAVNKALKERVTVTENGRRKTITKLEAAIKGLINRAVKGDAKAMQQLITLAPLVGVETQNSNDAPSIQDATVMQNLMKRFRDQLKASSSESPSS